MRKKLGDSLLKDLTLRTRAYGPLHRHLFNIVRNEIRNLSLELEIEIRSINTTKTGHIKLMFTGEDEKFFSNLLRNEFGAIPTVSDLRVGATMYGHLINVGRFGFGIYVNVGFPPFEKLDLLIPLFRLRQQLNMKDQPLRKIANTNVLVDNLPIEALLTMVDLANHKIEAELSEKELERIMAWSNDDHERLIVLGVSQTRLESVLLKTDHESDIYAIEELGKFEFSLCCKRSTRASGILAAIGPKLKGVPIHLFIPREVEEKRSVKT